MLHVARYIRELRQISIKEYGNTKIILADISPPGTNAIVCFILSNSRMCKLRLIAKRKLKAGAEKKKIKLSESMNPEWKDLAADCYPEKMLKDGVPVDLNK